VRTKTKLEAERVGKYMIRPVLALERLTFLEPEGKVGYRWGRMKIVAFITEVSVVDRIIDHLKLAKGMAPARAQLPSHRFLGG